MKTRIIYLWSILNGSFWFLPLLIVLTAILSAFGLTYLDSIVSYSPTGFIELFYSGGAESARSILTITAGAMIGVAGTVFSITLVVLTLASSQFGPRLLQNFMHDKVNQLVLGNYIATFIFCLLVLRTVNSDPADTFVPNISVLFTIFISIVNIFLLVIFIHHISISIQADYVISNINNNLHANIKRLFPTDMGEEKDKTITKKQLTALKDSYTNKMIVPTIKNGYLQAINNDSLIQTAVENNLLILFNYQPGDFLVENQELAKVYAKRTSDESVKLKIQNAFILGNKRTSTQDTEFAIHQMVEIAARALSPGVNDPYTAITCINHLTAVMCYLVSAQFPSPYRYDHEGNLRIVTKSLTFESMMDAAFNQIRQYGGNSPAVIIRLMEAYIIIYDYAIRKKQKEIVTKHVKMLYNGAKETMKERNDFKDLQQRYKKFEKP